MGLTEKFSLINKLNITRLQWQEIKKDHTAGLNQIAYKSPQDINNNQIDNILTYIKVFLGFCCIATGLYIIKVICQCFKLKSKCNFDSTSKKNKNKLTETCSQESNKDNVDNIIGEM